MYREILNELARWKEEMDFYLDKNPDKNPNKNIVLLSGSGKVGKTWVVKDFAEGFYENHIEIDFNEHGYVSRFFEGTPDRDMIERAFRISCGGEFSPEKTLIILENIHNLENVSGITAFLKAEFGRYGIIMTTNMEPDGLIDGSVKEIVEILNIYPLSFYEFLIVNQESALCREIQNYKETAISDESLKKLMDYLKLYYYTGGMPSVVRCWLEERDISKIDAAKKAIYDSYVEDFCSMGFPTLEDKIKKIFDSMGAQLLKENKKFQYGVVKITARAREYGEGLNRLLENRYLMKINRAVEGKAPLAQYADDKSFEIFMTDVGMLSYLYSLDFEQISEMFEKKSEYMDALTEQFVFQELQYNKNIGRLYYWVSEATAKINFLFEDTGMVIPVEINPGNNPKAQNVKVYAAKYNPPMVLSITKNVLEANDAIMRLPLFSVWNI